MILPILTIPNPILNKKSVAIKQFNQDLNDLVLDMVETLRANHGVGLAAPQIGKNIQLIVMEFDPSKFKDDQEFKNIQNTKIPLTIIINPKIISTSKEANIDSEGCLSCPNVEVDIKRFKKIKVIAQDLQSNRIKIKASDFIARILQHEIDHLNGILITDKVKNVKI